jgi:hypothetical protein
VAVDTDSIRDKLKNGHRTYTHRSDISFFALALSFFSLSEYRFLYFLGPGWLSVAGGLS